MKENDKIENGPEQNPGADRSVQTPRCSRTPRAKYKHRNHRRTGKIARLPAVIRHQICLMFTRYTEYKDIIAWLASQGHPNISHSNLSRWRKGGFQDWLRREQEKRLDLITMALEVLTEIIIGEKKVQPATGQSQPFVVRPLGRPLPPPANDPSTVGSAKVKPLTTDSPRFKKP